MRNDTYFPQRPDSKPKIYAYEDTNSQIEAARTGQGVCLAREEMIQQELKSGELVRLFDVEFFSGTHYFFVCPEDRLANLIYGDGQGLAVLATVA